MNDLTSMSTTDLNALHTGLLAEVVSAFQRAKTDAQLQAAMALQRRFDQVGAERCRRIENEYRASLGGDV